MSKTPSIPNHTLNLVFLTINIILTLGCLFISYQTISLILTPPTDNSSDVFTQIESKITQATQLLQTQTETSSPSSQINK